MKNYFFFFLMMLNFSLSGSDTIIVKGTVFYQTVFIGDRGFASVQSKCGDIEVSGGRVTVRYYGVDDIFVEESFTLGYNYIEEADHLAYVCTDNLGKKAYFHMWISSIDKKGLGYTIERPFYKETTLFVIDPGDRVDFNYKTGRINGGQRLHQSRPVGGRIREAQPFFRPMLVGDSNK